MHFADTVGAGAPASVVLKLQSMLSAIGFPIAKDGIWGSQTAAAVHAFQTKLGFDKLGWAWSSEYDAGIAGPETLAALDSAFKKKFPGGVGPIVTPDGQIVKTITPDGGASPDSGNRTAIMVAIAAVGAGLAFLVLRGAGSSLSSLGSYSRRRRRRSKGSRR